MSALESTTPVETPPPFFQRFIPSKAVVLDITERVLILMIYGQFAIRILSFSFATLNIGSFLLIMSEAIPLFFVLFRRFSSQISRDPFDWSVAIVGSALPLMVVPIAVHGPLVPPLSSDFIITFGLCGQIAAKVSLGRSFGIVAANRGVQINGPYRIVRHPMYLGYTMTHVGFLLMMPSNINLILYTLGFFLQIMRMLREENVLMRDPAYQEFARRVPYRLIPGVF